MIDLGLPDLSCITNPFACAYSWLDGLPFLYVLLAGVVVGMILGAILGKIGVAAVLTLGGAFLIWRKVEGDEPVETQLSPRDRQPPPRPKRGLGK